ncbi:MAG: carboxypeptidase-like regulatory domain-containing protein [Bacteroidota bacterium]
MRYIFVLLFVYNFSASAQQIDPRQKTIALYDSILTTVPREKIYLHFDKSTYLSTDTIWFKAYLINASLNTPSTLSGLIYTELINEDGEVIQRLSLPTAFGLTWGSFAINPNNYKPGKYTFRAYTNWMQNFGSECFFSKDIKIIPLGNSAPTTINNKNSATAKTAKPDSSIKEKLRDLDIQFLPEGGSWLANRRQKMAFKALNSNGKGIPVTGEIVDSKQNRIVSFSSNNKGMGVFNLHPQQDEAYSALINYNGITKTIQLPRTKNEGIALKVENEYGSDSITVTAFSTLANQEVTVVGQARGIICFVASVKFNGVNVKVFKIAKRIFPTGVCQVIMFDEKKKIINERNFFINHHDQLKLSISSTSLSYKLRDSIPLQINVVDAAGKSSISSFSIAITDNQQVAKDSVNDETILSYFLMNSDLKGEIENPGYYFYQPSEQKHLDLEALMLTQGWVSYDWDLTKKPLFITEKEYVISGKVSNIMNKPLAKAKIILMGTNKGFMLMDTVTNDRGEFVFNKLPMLDSASFIIQAKNEKGRTGTAGIVLNEFNAPAPPITSLKNPVSEKELGDSISKNLIATKSEEYKLTRREGLLLNEVTIVGKRTIKGSKNLNGAGEADQIITDEELARVSKKTLYDVLSEKVKGFRTGYPKKSTNRIFFIHFNVLKLIIDGIEVDFFYSADGAPDSYYHYIKSYLDYYQAEDIKGIEVMQNRRFSSSYKSEFMDPRDETEYSFLEITTKTGQGPFLKKSANMYLLKPINYGDNKVFYSPKYTVANKSDKKPDFRSTIYWHPNLLTNEKGEGNISFFAADKPGDYTVWIEGMDLQGNFGFKTLKLIIK